MCSIQARGGCLLSRLKAGPWQLSISSISSRAFLQRKGNFCVSPICQSPTIYFSCLSHVQYFARSLQKLSKLKFQLTLAVSAVTIGEFFILYEMSMSLQCFGNLPKLERDQDLDASVDTSQLFPLEIQCGFSKQIWLFLLCELFSLAVVPCTFISFLHQPDPYFCF